MRSVRVGIVAVAIAVAAAVWFAWPRLPEGVVRRDAVFNDRTVQLLVVALPQEAWEWSVAEDAAQPKTVAEWRKELGADIVFNAAYFDEDFSAVGWLREDKGASAVPWPTQEEQADPHGFTFLVDPHVGGIALAYLPSAPREEPLASALLSFPTLLVDGRPMVEEDSGLYAARTMLAEDAAGREYLVVTESGSMTLYEAAQWLAAQPEGFVLAGNLDGGPSAGLSMRGLEEPSAAVPSVIAGDGP